MLPSRSPIALSHSCLRVSGASARRPRIAADARDHLHDAVLGTVSAASTVSGRPGVFAVGSWADVTHVEDGKRPGTRGGLPIPPTMMQCDEISF